MAPLSLDEPTGRYLSFVEREEIALLKAQGKGVREIAREIGRDPGTVSRELRRNAATRGGKPVYRAVVAQWKAQQAAKRPKTAKLVNNDRLREYGPGPARRERPPPRRHDRVGSDAAAVEGAEQAPSSGPAVVDGVEPGADRAPDEGRVPR
jgi:transposase-like protein